MNLSAKIRFLFPYRCACCDRVTTPDSPTCKDCTDNIIHPVLKGSICSKCMQLKKNCICPERSFFTKICALFYYEGKARKTVHRFKFRSRPDLYKSYSDLLCRSLEEWDMLESTDIITYMPMTKRAIFRRGYNQAEIIAKAVAEKTGKECVALLIKSEDTKRQHSLTKAFRTGNLLGIFEPDKRYLDKIEGKTILIIDDVCTTGNSLSEVSKTLLIFGADKTYAAICCISKPKKNIEQKNLL